MPSKIDIASNALVLVGDSPINSFTEPGAGAGFMASFYEPTVKALLTDTYWGFALKKQKLNKLSQIPLNDFQHAFQIPPDNLKVLKVNPRGFYKIYRDLIYTNANDIDLDYIFRIEEAFWPHYFERAVTYRLASDAAIPITENESKAALYEEKFRQAMNAAFGADAQQNPQVPIVDQPFTDVRNGGFGRNGFF